MKKLKDLKQGETASLASTKVENQINFIYIYIHVHIVHCCMILSCQVVPAPHPQRMLAPLQTQSWPCSSEHTPVCTLSLTCSYTHIRDLLDACNTTCVRRPLAQPDDP